jgi:hypothetical protein
MSLTPRRNDFGVFEYPPTEISDGSQTVTTAGIAVQLSTTSTPCKKILITALGANSGNIWVGGSTVANGRGKQLVPLQDLELEIDDLNKIYIDSTSSGDGVAFLYVTY